MTTQSPINSKPLQTVDIAYIGMFVALMAVCSWISVPTTVPFTLQTFAVFLAVMLLGGMRGTIAVAVYILLGAVGAPVFSGFGGGLSKLLGPSGGYIIGFLFTALSMWGILKLFGEKKNKIYALAIACIVGLFFCYLFGTLWFSYLYYGDMTFASIAASLSMCVFPFILPDLCKIAIALLITPRLRRFVK